jgi:hypothetical protein
MIMGDQPQRHIHYVKTTFGQKLFYIGAGALLYWFAFANGCDKTKAYFSRVSRATPAVAEGYYQTFVEEPLQRR